MLKPMALVVWYGWYGLVHLGDLGVKWHGGTTAGCPKNPQILGDSPVLWSVSKLETNFSEQKIQCQNSAVKSIREPKVTGLNQSGTGSGITSSCFFRFISLSGRGGSRGHTMWKRHRTRDTMWETNANKCTQTCWKMIRPRHPAAETVWETKNYNVHIGKWSGQGRHPAKKAARKSLCGNKWREMKAHIGKWSGQKGAIISEIWQTRKRNESAHWKWSRHQNPGNNHLGDKLKET